MLLLLFNRSASDPTAPVYSSNYGTLCLETTVHTTTLVTEVLIDQLESSVLIGQLEAAVETTTLSNTYTC